MMHPKHALNFSPGIADTCGTQYLEQKCNRLLTRHIARYIPELKSQLVELHTAAQEVMPVRACVAYSSHTRDVALHRN